MSGTILSADKDIENYVIPTQPTTPAVNTHMQEWDRQDLKRLSLIMKTVLKFMRLSSKSETWNMNMI